MKKLIITFVAVIIIAVIATTTSCKHERLATNDVTPIDTTKKDTTKTTGGGTVTVVDKGDSTGWKCSPDTIYFQDVLPIIISSCATAGCHDAATRASGYQYTDYATILRGGIVAGNANSGKFFSEIKSGSMPPRSSGIVMTQAQKDLLAAWVNKGAKNYVCNANYGKCDSTKVSFATFVKPIIENRCQGCHGGTIPSGGINLTTYAQIKASALTPAFMGSMRKAAGFSFMPKGGFALTPCELNKMEAWIKRGTPNN